MKNILSKSGSSEFISRIEKLTAKSAPQWGKMTVAQMLAHCCVAYEMTFEDIHPKPNPIKRFFIKLFVKKIVVGPNPYKKNSPTAAEFKIDGERNFETEKGRLINYVTKTANLESDYFENRESHSLGILSKEEWNVMFAKHLDHHLTQFGV